MCWILPCCLHSSLLLHLLHLLLVLLLPLPIHLLLSFLHYPTAKGIKPGEKPSASSEDGAKTPSAVLSKDKKEKPSSGEKKSKKDSKSKSGAMPPVEASQPPPDLVALGKPKDKLLKRPRSVPRHPRQWGRWPVISPLGAPPSFTSRLNEGQCVCVVFVSCILVHTHLAVVHRHSDLQALVS